MLKIKLKENLVQYSIYAILAFVLVSSILSFWNRHVANESQKLIETTSHVKALTKCIREDLVNDIDLSTLSYVTSKNDVNLISYEWVKKSKDSVFTVLKKELALQEFTGVEQLDAINLSIDKHLKKAEEVISAAKAGNQEKAESLLKEFFYSDNQLFESFQKAVNKFENEIEAHARSDYEWSLLDNSIIQVILILLSLPILLATLQKLSNEIKKNYQLLKRLEENNRLYLFNDGAEIEINADQVVEKSIQTFKTAFLFVEDVSRGEYKKANALVPSEVLKLNEGTLMGALVKMSDKLKLAEEEDRKRKWSADGLNQFYEIVKNNEHDLKALSDKAVVFLTNYLHSQQGSLFSRQELGDEVHLTLDACYAYNRKKWLEKRIEVGVGIVGQAYLEKQPVLLTEVPNGYTTITSGLGEVTPKCLLIVPFIYNEKIEAIYEVAGFTKYETFEIEFLKKAGEFLAAALQSVKNNSKMQKLLNQAQEQSETLKAQEEELRQNMEELEATNIALNRKEKELKKN